MDIRRLFSFEGRINRQTYWIIAVIFFIIYAVLAALMQSKNNGVIALAGIVYLALIVPSLATGVKRWHDRDKSGWWVLIALVPVIGAIWSLIELGFLPGTPGNNRFGAPSSGSPFETERPAAFPVQ